MGLKENFPPSFFESTSFPSNIQFPGAGETKTLTIDSDTYNYIRPKSNPNVPSETRKPFKKSFGNRLLVKETELKSLKELSFLRNEQITPFQQLYYSKANIQAVQKLIRYQIQKEYGYVIPDQDEIQVLQLMRVMEVRYSITPTCVSQFVDETMKLNSYSVKYSIPKIISAIEQQKGYLRDFDHYHETLLPLPQNGSSFGLNKIQDIKNYLDLS